MSVEEGTVSDAEAQKRARREELKRKWLEKRAAEEARRKAEQAQSPLEKLVDAALTPTYIAVGAGIILFRKLTGRPSVTVEDFE